ncbi:hypothetical protein IIA16_01290 [bacterium]|nr:hypothetical protein [bacterium]
MLPLALAFGLFQVPTLLPAPAVPVADAILAVAADNRGFALYSPDGDGRWTLRVYDSAGKAQFAWRPLGDVIRPLDLALGGGQVRLASWPQGLYVFDLEERAVVTKVSGTHDIFRHLPPMLAKWGVDGRFHALTRAFDSRTGRYRPRLMTLDLALFVPDTETTITIGGGQPDLPPGIQDRLTDQGTVIEGLLLAPIEGEVAMGCLDLTPGVFVYLCQFDKVLVYRLEDESYISREQTVLPDVVRDLSIAGNGRIIALADDGSRLFITWSGFDAVTERSAEDIAALTDADCEGPVLLDIASGPTPWVLLSCPEPRTLWAVPIA